MMLECYNCGKEFGPLDNLHKATDGNDVCAECCDVCTDDEKPYAICHVTPCDEDGNPLTDRRNENAI